MLMVDLSQLVNIAILSNSNYLLTYQDHAKEKKDVNFTMMIGTLWEIYMQIMEDMWRLGRLK